MSGVQIVMKNILRLMRPKHYLKNGLIFVSLIFSKNLFNFSMLIEVFAGFVIFSLLSSVVYIMNDIQDVEADRNHEVKRNRPIASGEVAIPTAIVLASILFAIAIGLNIFVCGILSKATLIMVAYFIINLGYSMGLKNIPFLDIFLLVMGFLLRVLYGAAIINDAVSSWVLLSVISISFYLALGKRRNEILKSRESESTRKVLKFYSFNFLDKFMYLCLAISIVFYALWSADTDIIQRYGTDKLVWTVPLVIIIMMKYSADIESDSHGDPVDVIVKDKILMCLALLFAIILISMIYL